MDYKDYEGRVQKAEWIRAVNEGYEEKREAFYQSDDGDTYDEYLDRLEEYKKDLQKFYTSIKEFSAIKPWEWLGDTDIFAIKFENDDDTYFCCVLGGGEQIYGMSIYRGLKGIDSYLKTLEGDFDTPEEALHIMDTISIYLKDRKDLTKEDFNMIQLSGVTIRGKKQWPVIRVFEPGFPPRLMDEFDLSKIVRVTEVITDYTLYLKENMDKASLLKEGKYILREYDETGSYKEYIKKYDDFFSTHSEAYEMPILYHDYTTKS